VVPPRTVSSSHTAPPRRSPKAGFLGRKGKKTEVFCRFSAVLGSRGSADTVRDTHGFAVKFYTDEGNFDLVGNNIPVFFIQDGIKFPDVIHAGKPHPDREIPQAQSAHDTFWDFASLHTEATGGYRTRIACTERQAVSRCIRITCFVTNCGQTGTC
jgi:catalase